MDRRRLSLTLVFAALLGVCGLCALTVYGSVNWIVGSGTQVRLFEFANSKATRTESKNFTAKPGLIIETQAGSVTITAAQVDQIEVEMTFTAWGSNQAEAQAAVESLQVSVEEDGGTLRLVYDPPEEFGFIVSRGGADSVDFDVRVPAGTAVEVVAGFGEVSVSGLEAGVKVTSSFGEVSARDIQAGVGDVSLQTSFGEILLENAAGRDVSLDTSNGDIRVTQVDASASVFIETSFGDVHVMEISAGSLDVKNSNGDITVNQGSVEGEIKSATSFGDIIVTGVNALSYTLHTSNGRIELDTASGLLDLKSSFGNLVVSNATDAVLNLETSNGEIRFSGSLDSQVDHRVETSFGGIILTLPADSAFDLHLDTSFGEINSDLPVTLAGTLSETTWEAQLNGGGSLLEVFTSNGNISLRSLTGSE